MTFKPSTSDEAVKKATGKDWKSWYRILDKEKAYKLKHTQIAQAVYKISGKHWWSQMVANTYEQYKGLRKKYENTQGFNVSVSRTIEKPIKDLYTWGTKLKGLMQM
jgi:hypothetical protein